METRQWGHSGCISQPVIRGRKFLFVWFGLVGSFVVCLFVVVVLWGVFVGFILCFVVIVGGGGGDGGGVCVFIVVVCLFVCLL